MIWLQTRLAGWLGSSAARKLRHPRQRDRAGTRTATSHAPQLHTWLGRADAVLSALLTHTLFALRFRRREGGSYRFTGLDFSFIALLISARPGGGP